MIAASRLVLALAAGSLFSAPQLAAQMPGFPSFPRRADAPAFEAPPPTAEAQRRWSEFYAEQGFFSRKDSRVFSDAYVAILARWAERPTLDTLDLLAEFEARLDRSDPCFVAVQNRNLEALAERTPGALAAVLPLHAFSWHHHLVRGRFQFLAGTTKRLERWSRLHVQAAGDQARARREAADTLTRLGAMIWESGFVNLLDQAGSALDRALELEPGHRLARELRAMVAEKQGRYRVAQEHLELLHRTLPDRPDVALRLAVQLVRLDRFDEAASLLRSTAEEVTGEVTGEAPAWPRIVAAQEWARLERRQGRAERARQILEAAAARFPGVERFEIMLADLEREQNHQPTARTIRLLANSGQRRQSELSPRLRYLQIRPAALEANAARVEETLLGGLEPLRAALAAHEESVPSRRCSGLLNDLAPRRSKASTADSVPPMLPSSPSPSTPMLPSSPSPSMPMLPSTPMLPSSPSPPSPFPASPDRSDAGPAAEAPVPTADTERAEIEASLRKGVYVDPRTGESIRIDMALELELRQIYVTPRRLGRGGPLEKHEIELVDEGVRQRIVTFEQGDIPFTAAVLIDASGSMEGSRLARALAGAQTFIDGMATHDRSRLIVASDRLESATPLLSASEDLRPHLRAVAGGGTALFDHLFLAIDSLEPEQGRKVVIVLSDGYDLMSSVPMASIAEALRRSQIQLYWARLREGRTVRLELTPPTNWRSQSETRDELHALAESVEHSGGRVVEISRFDDVAGAFTEILAELRSQVAIGYYAEPAYGDGRWREIEVETSRAGVRLRHAPGYVDD